MAKVYHSEIFGLREAKYDWLNKHNINNVKWNKLEPRSDFYLFIEQNRNLQLKYSAYFLVNELFPLNNTGIVTKRDSFVIGINKNEITQRLRIFSDQSLSDEFVSRSLKLPLKDKDKWNLPEARKQFFHNKDFQSFFSQIQYRPFDKRWIFYHPTLVARRVEKVMIHLLQDNLSVCIGRQGSVTGSNNYDIVFISDNIVDLNLFRRGGELVFPLYIYPDLSKKDLFSEHETGGKKPNIKPELFEELKKNFWESIPLGKKEVTPEEIFYYIYAVLYSNTYRTKYAEFLKIDFPRIPFTKDYKLFIQLGKFGKQLADLHLLKSKDLDKTISKFPNEGSNKVEKPKYENEKVWINKEQYFDGIEEEVWQYQIGGYQVCEKWLKDRKKRTLTLDEIKTYCKIVTSLSKTIDLQIEIDKYFEEVEKTV